MSPSDWPVGMSVGAFSCFLINVGAEGNCGQCHPGQVVLGNISKVAEHEAESKPVWHSSMVLASAPV